ncbi:hypothetical protein NPIL_591301 [Nephila pilipes]|uniref:Uncharacterized protein n=1 Tax=Nephila pilipes TaxID=299642 RepID=A0A8X6UMB0_NEPPI|nr:hypothetical protein NPIL_591301 [Nephila pilipes]
MLLSALLLISNKRREGLRSPSCIPEIRPRKLCSSDSAYCEQSLFRRAAYGLTAGGFKIISPTIPSSSGCNAESTWWNLVISVVIPASTNWLSIWLNQISRFALLKGGTFMETCAMLAVAALSSSDIMNRNNTQILIARYKTNTEKICSPSKSSFFLVRKRMQVDYKFAVPKS